MTEMLTQLEIVATILLMASCEAQDCLRANSYGGDSLPSFSDPGNGAPRIANNPIQAIIKSYEFHCCGVLSGWAAYVQPGGGGHDKGYNITFQIWRPIGGNSYAKIGENSFPLVQVSDSRIEEELSSNKQLHFQLGDVLGYYLEQGALGNNGGVLCDELFTQEELWYSVGHSKLRNENRLDIGTGGDLSLSTTLGPIISVSLSTTAHNCPSTFTSTMPYPSPTPLSLSTISVLTPPTATIADISGNTPHNTNTALYIGIIVSLVALLFIVAMTAMVTVACVSVKKKKTQPDLVIHKTATEENGSPVNATFTEPLTERNQAYGQPTGATPTTQYDYVEGSELPDTARGLPISQNPAYGKVPTRAEDDQRYYVEGMEAYGQIDGLGLR